MLKRFVKDRYASKRRSIIFLGGEGGGWVIFKGKVLYSKTAGPKKKIVHNIEQKLSTIQVLISMLKISCTQAIAHQRKSCTT